MPRLIVKGWGVVVDLTWGIVEGALDAARNNTNSTDTEMLSSDLETNILNICRGGATVYAARSLLKDLIIGASPTLSI